MDIYEEKEGAAKKIEDISEAIASVIDSEAYVPPSRDKVIHDAIEYFHKNKDIPDNLWDYQSALIHYINRTIELDNTSVNGKHRNKYKGIEALGISELIDILPHMFNFKNVKRANTPDNDTAELMVQTENGWYESAWNTIGKTCLILARKESCSLKKIADIESGLETMISDAVQECTNPDDTPLKNGVFNKAYWEKHKTLKPYSTDEVYVNPFPVEFNPSATNPEIDFDGEIFNVEDWLLELAAGDEDIKQLLWNTLSCLLHPNRKYKKCVILFSPVGNNGKGTFLQLCRNIVGANLSADMPVNAFSDKSLVINLAYSRLVAGDENPVDTYIDDITHFKNAITGDPITVDRKYKDSLTFCFRGLVIQCMNSMPLSKDKTNSYYRRLLTIPFNANFAGVEKDEIKSVYIKDKRVLEYIVHKALMIDLQPNELVAPDAATELLNSYKENNDTILQWWNDCEDEFAWDRIPFKLLYASYDYWVQNYTAKRDRNISLTKFTREFKTKILPLMDDWELPNKDCKFGPSEIMRTVPEPLIAKYGLDEFKNPLYTGKDWDKIGSNGGQLKKEYRGIVKKSR